VTVHRFRSAVEMHATPVATTESFDRFLRHCARYWAIAPRIYPRGVFKYRTLEAAQLARQEHAHPSLARPSGTSVPR
jgi:hypothetical protein